MDDAQTAQWARELAATEDEIARLVAEDRAARRELRQALAAQRQQEKRGLK